MRYHEFFNTVNTVSAGRHLPTCHGASQAPNKGGGLQLWRPAPSILSRLPTTGSYVCRQMGGA